MNALMAAIRIRELEEENAKLKEKLAAACTVISKKTYLKCNSTD